MCWVGWPFSFRQQHRQVTGQLRAAAPTAPGSAKPATSSYASLLCRNHFVALRRQRSAKFPRQAPSRELWHDRLTLGCTSKAALARGAVSGHSRLTVHSSRRRYAARLNSRVRRRCVGLAGPSSFGGNIGKSLVGSGEQFQLLLAAASPPLRLTLHCSAAIISSHFGGKARQGFPGKFHPASCGMIGSRWVAQARQHWPGAVVGHSRLTVHSSRTRCAGRLNSRVRRQ